jgi:hypothetical protein
MAARARGTELVACSDEARAFSAEWRGTGWAAEVDTVGVEIARDVAARVEVARAALVRHASIVLALLAVRTDHAQAAAAQHDQEAVVSIESEPRDPLDQDVTCHVAKEHRHGDLARRDPIERRDADATLEVLVRRRCGRLRRARFEGGLDGGELDSRNEIRSQVDLEHVARVACAHCEKKQGGSSGVRHVLSLPAPVAVRRIGCYRVPSRRVMFRAA